MYVNYYDRKIKHNDKNKTILSSEYKLHMSTEQKLINAIEEEKKNFELNK